MKYKFECSNRFLRFIISVPTIIVITMLIDLYLGTVFEGVIYWCLNFMVIYTTALIISLLIKSLKFIRVECMISIIGDVIEIEKRAKIYTFNLGDIEDINYFDSKIYNNIWFSNWDILRIETRKQTIELLAKPNESKGRLEDRTLYKAMTYIKRSRSTTSNLQN